MESLYIVLIGFLTGLAVGFTSIGSGSVSTVGLLLFSGYSPAQIVSANIVNGTFMKSMGAVKHVTQGHLDFRSSMPFIIAGIPGALFGSIFTREISFEPFKMVLGILMFLFSLVILSEVFFMGEVKKEFFKLFDKFGSFMTVIMGVAIGFVVGFSSLGSGQLMVISMLYFQRLSVKSSVGSALFCGAFILAVSSFIHFFIGHFNWGLIGKLLFGSLPGVWIGSHYCSRCNEKYIKFVIGFFILVGGIVIVLKNL